jgi:hypothetical protein
METKEILNELERDYKPVEGTKTLEKVKADKFNAVRLFYIIYVNKYERIIDNLNY